MDNSVFISYRREASAYLARAVFQDLRAHSIDTFVDVESIDQGPFDTIIFNQIAARPYFVLLLTPGTLQRCREPKDCLRREIEEALRLGRKIILLHTPQFKFGDMETYLEPLTKKELRRFKSIHVPHDFFEIAMNKLRAGVLKPIDLPTTPVPTSDHTDIQRKIMQAASQPKVTEQKLSAQECYERALTRQHTHYEAQIADCSQAISLNPQFIEAYYHRGVIRSWKRDLDGAIADYSEVLRLNPQFPDIYLSRGGVRYIHGDIEGALADFDRAISINPQDARAYYNRGVLRGYNKKDLDGAISDYDEALRLNPQFAEAYFGRGVAHDEQGDLDAAMTDYDESVRYNPRFAAAYTRRGNIRQTNGDLGWAIADYNESIRLDPQDGNAYYNRGKAYDKQGNTRAACADLRRVLALSPNLAEKEMIHDYLANNCGGR